MKEKNILKAIRIGKNWFGTLLLSTTISLYCYTSSAFAAAQTIGEVAAGITGSFKQIGQLITAGAYVAGLGFALSAILKFKQHKDNPTQIPIGTPIALLFISAALIFLPTIFGIAGLTIFGSQAVAGSATGWTGDVTVS